MRIVVDANVIISGVFFGDALRKVVEAVAAREVSVSATPERADEACRVLEVEEPFRRKGLATCMQSHHDLPHTQGQDYTSVHDGFTGHGQGEERVRLLPSPDRELARAAHLSSVTDMPMC
jgi:hypothetical protein